MFSVQYIKMCIEAKSELEHIRIITESQGRDYMPDFSFENGDYIHHPKMGAEGFQIITRLQRDVVQGSETPYPYRKEECYWIPKADQIINELEGVFSFSKEVIHVLMSEGGTALDGAFHRISNFNDEAIRELFTHEVFSLLLRQKLIGLPLVEKILR